MKKKMSKIKNPLSSKVLSSNWLITLTSTMLGVILGLYLNSYYENKQLIEAKGKALEQVLSEVSENEKLLTAYNDTLKVKFKSLIYLFSKLDKNNSVIIHKDSLDLFKRNSKRIFNFKNFEEDASGNMLVRHFQK